MWRRPVIAFLFAAAFFALFAPACGRTTLLESPVGAEGTPCATADECDDRDACTDDFCVSARCTHQTSDRDHDGIPAANCGGADCQDDDPAAHPGAAEVCGNGKDDDCNGLSDCADPACNGHPPCGCGGAEICDNQVDDNCDGNVDCADPSCRNGPSCPCGPVETCGDGVDNDCNGKIDCADATCAGTPGCCKGPESCSNGIDDDCNGKIDCDDAACAKTPECICRQSKEVCSNKKDDNCNLLVDCADPACVGSFACKCTGPAVPEVCDDARDNDCDGKVDCADPDCAASPSCSACKPEDCSNKADDDCNGLVDCADPACTFSPACKPIAEICNNGLDDDHNNATDCDDIACKANPLCTVKHSNCLTALAIGGSGTWSGDTTGFIGKTAGSCGGAAGEAVFALTLTDPSRVEVDTIGSSFDSTLYVRAGACGAGRELACDDDSGGSHNAKITFPLLYPGTYFIFVDGFTIDISGADEGAYKLHVKVTANPSEICNNGIDDDGDHLADCADGDCASAPACAGCNGGLPPEPEMGPARCTDGLDNDCDGVADCADKDCHASDFYVSECCNGLDENGNGIIDDFSCRCVTNADCDASEICYTDTVFACGPPCTTFRGDVCPFVAAGSSCDSSKNQCEFP